MSVTTIPTAPYVSFVPPCAPNVFSMSSTGASLPSMAWTESTSTSLTAFGANAATTMSSGSAARNVWAASRALASIQLTLISRPSIRPITGVRRGMS